MVYLTDNEHIIALPYDNESMNFMMNDLGLTMNSFTGWSFLLPSKMYEREAMVSSAWQVDSEFIRKAVKKEVGLCIKPRAKEAVNE